MFRVYARIVLFVIGLVAAVILFAFAFTAASVIVLVGLAGLALFGRPRMQWTVVRSGDFAGDRQRASHPLVIDHDPNDLPRRD